MSSLPLTAPDLVCYDDVDPLAAETQSDLESFAQDVYHLLLELPGTNPDDPNRGIGIELYLSGTFADFAKLPALIEQQIGDDPRATGCSCSITSNSNGTYGINIQIACSTGVLPLNFEYSAASGLTRL